MQRYALIGSPIAHSRSPRMQQAAFDALGLPARYEAIEAGIQQAANITRALREAQFSGWNVTTPLKEATFELVDRATAEAQQSHAVNTVRVESDGALLGHNTDGAGFLRAVAELWDWQPKDATAIILGSGPAARAIAASLRGAGARPIWCWSRSADRAAQIGPPPRERADIVVSALPPQADVPPGSGWSDNRTFLFDLNYGRDRGFLSSWPGRAFSDGLALLLHQGALSFEWWTGRAAPLEVMRLALRTPPSASAAG